MPTRLSLFLTLLAAPALLTGCAEAERIARQATLPTGPTPTGTSTSGGMITISTAGWYLKADQYVNQVGQRYAYDCIPNPSREHGYVWGSGPYTADSSVCAAGVHAGAITFARGGRVVIEMRPGQNRFVGTERHGVTSIDYDQPWDNSYAVVL